MKQTETPLQTDIERAKTYLNKLWICNHINNDIDISQGSPAWIRRDIDLRGQTLILCIKAHNTYNIRPGFERVFIKFNKHGLHGDTFPLVYDEHTDLYFKFEGFENYSMFCYAGMSEEYKLDIYEILIDQSEDIEIYSHPITIQT